MSRAPADSPWPMYGGNNLRNGMQPHGQLSFNKKLCRVASTTVSKGYDHTFFVHLKGAFPRTYQWERNGVPIQGATQPSLTIENATSKDSGLYRATITNKHGSVTSNEAVLKVVSPGAPQIFADGKEVVGSVVKGDKTEITLSTSFKGGSILYTLDGSEPSFESTPYQASFTVSKTIGIRAIAYKQDFSDLAEADPVFINIVPNYNLNVSIEGQGAVVKDPPDGPYIQDSVVKLKAVPAEGWEFAGWSGALMSSFGEGSVVMGGNKSVTAKFERIPECKIIPEVTGGGEIYGLTPKKIYTLGKVGDPIRNGFQITFRKSDFKKVKDISDNKSFIEIKLSEPNADFHMQKDNRTLLNSRESQNLFLNQKINKIILSDDNNHSLDYYNNVSIRVAAGHALMEEQVVEYCIIQLNIENSIYRYRWHPGFEDLFYQGVEIKLSAKPDEGYKFFGWSGDAAGTNSELTLTMDRDKTVEAVFGTELSTIATGKGKLIINPASGPYPYGTKVSITPVPDAGYYLGLWGGAAFGLPKGPIEYGITEANPKFTALFVPLKENRFTITTLVSSGGSVVSNPNSNAYVNGQQVTLTATPEPGYSFVGWTGDIESTTNPLVTLADSNKTVTAEFRRNIIAPVTLTINAENGTVTRTPSDELYEKGTSVELFAQANAGYTFTGWAGALGGTASRATLFLDGD
ncbi:chitobiase/beta-hexosaminidase C-terminal domain-containing protein, partial [bacterium]|nr:chitobiase/beta-hexosaminidase C-terminal domain-containing protein [bacterium]